MRAAIVLAASIGVISGCGGSASTQPSGAGSSSLTSSASGSSSGDAAVLEYVLGPGSRVNVESTGTSWPADKGALTVTKLSSGDVRLVARALPTNADGVSWSLDITISPSGRSVSGSLTSGETSWRVVSHTGVITNTTTSAAVRYWTVRAVTMAQRHQKSTGPMTFVLSGKASTP